MQDTRIHVTTARNACGDTPAPADQSLQHTGTRSCAGTNGFS